VDPLAQPAGLSRPARWTGLAGDRPLRPPPPRHRPDHQNHRHPRPPARRGRTARGGLRIPLTA
jgi:hypothetical protein